MSKRAVVEYRAVEAAEPCVTDRSDSEVVTGDPRAVCVGPVIVELSNAVDVPKAVVTPSVVTEVTLVD